MIKNTQTIVDLCQAELVYHQSLLPQFVTPNGEVAKEYLWSVLIDKLNEWNLHNDQYLERLKHEYEIITNMGFEDYFLIVSDLIHYAKTHDVMVGPGRGSSAGSLVSYLLGLQRLIRLNLTCFSRDF